MSSKLELKKIDLKNIDLKKVDLKVVKDFKKFAFKGNVMDMAVGIIIGGAFTTIVTSLVNNILMPLISFGTAGIDFTDMKFVLRPAVITDGVETAAECAIGYGLFIQNIIYFFLVAISVFIFLRILNHRKIKTELAAAVKAKEDADTAKLAADAAAEAAALKAKADDTRATHVETLLGEIRDLLKKQSNT
jgi:large conductance mechanosensitive channel protein